MGVKTLAWTDRLALRNISVSTMEAPWRCIDRYPVVQRKRSKSYYLRVLALLQMGDGETATSSDSTSLAFLFLFSGSIDKKQPCCIE